MSFRIFTILRIFAIILYIPMALCLGNERQIGIRMIMTRGIDGWPSGIILFPIIAVVIFVIYVMGGMP